MDLFAGFERRQEVTKCWRKEDGRWVVKDIAFVDQWSQDEYRFLVRCLVGTICHGGMVCGAFLGDVLKGFVSVEGEKIGSRGQYMDLTSLHVSLDLRGNGVGTALFQRAAAWARQQGGREAVHFRPFRCGDTGILSGHGLCGSGGISEKTYGAGTL